jgi:RNA polymerase sigma-70 factor (ECF subfamily)
MSSDHQFPSTRWTCIQRICSGNKSEARAAMEEVCQTYWRPLYGFAISMNPSHQDAEDCVQGFLVRVSSEDFFDAMTPHRGKLRSYLLVSFKRYIYDSWKKQSSQKRGGANRDLTLDEFLVEDEHGSDPALAYDQEWAKVVVDDTHERLKNRYIEQGNIEIFNELESCIDGTPLVNTADTAQKLNLSSVALKSAVHRIRRRFGDELRKVVAETVHSEDDVEEEIRWLIKILQR